MNMQNFQFILVIISLLIGMTSAIYFYQSSDIFTTILKKPLKLISSGMIIISFGILLAVLITFFQNQGYQMFLFHIPTSAFIFIIYLIGSWLIFSGARQFAHKPV